MTESIDARWSDLVAVVTGAGRGIGRTIAVGLAARGAEVVLVARSPEEIGDVAAEISAAGGRAIPVVADVIAEGDVERVAAATTRAAPSLLVNAAGVFGPLIPIVDSDPIEWARPLLVNMMGAYLMSRRLAPAMVAAGWGRILNVSSAAALHTPGPLNSAYGTSKAALNQFTRTWRPSSPGRGLQRMSFTRET